MGDTWCFRESIEGEGGGPNPNPNLNPKHIDYYLKPESETDNGTENRTENRAENRTEAGEENGAPMALLSPGEMRIACTPYMVPTGPFHIGDDVSLVFQKNCMAIYEERSGCLTYYISNPNSNRNPNIGGWRYAYPCFIRINGDVRSSSSRGIH